jgi:hypothetical protein
MKNIIFGFILTILFFVTPIHLQAEMVKPLVTKSELTLTESKSEAFNKEITPKVKKNTTKKSQNQKSKPNFEFLPNGWLPIGIVLILVGAVLALFLGFIAWMGLVIALVGLGFVVYWIVKEVTRRY